MHNEPCLIDFSIWIEGQRNPAWLANLTKDMTDVATCQIAVAEYRVGLYAPREKTTREEARAFLNSAVAAVASFPHVPEDFDEASRLIGEAIYASKGKPNFPDGMIAATARRMGRTVWTKDRRHFEAMDCRVFNPLENVPGEQTAG